MTEQKNNFIACNYVAAFIDILGQQKELESFPRLPDTNDQKIMSEFTEVVKATVGAVDSLSKNIQTFFESASKHRSEATGNIPEELQSVRRQLEGNEIHFQRFSDGLFIYVSIASNRGGVPVSGVFDLLTACGTACLVSLAANRPVRGGIEIGWGIESHPDELYGAVVARAYNLESRVAGYPRFVVGDQLAEYLCATALSSEKSVPAELGRSLAGYCEKMLTVDDDGYPIIDYLGDMFRETVSGDVSHAVVQKAYDFVLSESIKWKECKNTKLAFRYTMLRDYFQARLPFWGIKITSDADT